MLDTQKHKLGEISKNFKCEGQAVFHVHLANFSVCKTVQNKQARCATLQKF